MKFELDEDQLKLLKQWQKKIEKHKDNSVSGGRYTYKFTPTGIGDIVVVKDHNTGKKIDLSMIEKW